MTPVRRPLAFVIPAVAAALLVGRACSRAAGGRRARHPADRQRGRFRDRGDRRRRRRPRRPRRRGSTAGAGRSARLADALGADAPPARSPRRRTLPIACSTGSSRASSSSRSRSARSATSRASASVRPRARRADARRAGPARRSAPMLVIPVMVSGAVRRQLRGAQPNGSAPGRSSAPPTARSTMSGPRARVSTRCCSTWRRPSGAGAAGGACCSTNMARPHRRAPGRACGAPIPADRSWACSPPAMVPTTS